jgi:hypothetical protein
VRIGPDHPYPSASETRRRLAAPSATTGFADALTSAAETGAAASAGSHGHEPELSAATYRLFAAVALERGDTAHADHFRARAADAREAGLPLHPSGVLAENGRWDYTSAAAAIPETGRFDTASGQGTAAFVPYDTTARSSAPQRHAPATPTTIANLRGTGSARAAAHPELDALLATLAS